MTLPFTITQFFAVFERYNEAIWPLQVVAYLAGLALVALIALRSKHAGSVAAAVLAAMWLVNGVGYHLAYFSEINRAALLFGALFVVQAALIAWVGLGLRRLQFGLHRDLTFWVAAAGIVYSIVVYPLLGLAFGHVYPAAPVFGVAPCPTTIFTLAVLLLARPTAPAWLFVIPIAWSGLGGSAAVYLDVREDFGLFAMGLAAAALLVAGNARSFALRHSAK